MPKAKDSDNAAIAPDGMGSLGDAVGLAATETPCQAMGKKELTPNKIFVKRTDNVVCRVFLCNAPALAIVSITDGMGNKRDLANQQIPPPNPLPVTVLPSSIPAGDYSLIWTLFPPPGTDWQMVVDVSVNEATVFRQFKSAKSQFPMPRGFLFMEVQ